MAWTLAAVGDIMLQHPVGDSPAFTWLRQSDLAFGNLEVPLSARGYPADKPITFRSDPALAGQLSHMGLDVVSFANNHALDYGIPALLDTVAAVEEAGVVIIGAGETLEEAIRPRILRAGGTAVAFVGFASTLPTSSAATAQRPGVAPVRVMVHLIPDSAIFEEQPGTSPYVQTATAEDDVAQAREAIGAARAQAETVVASIHWGVPPGWAAPFQGVLADYQQPLAHALIDAGADIVLGHHPHTLHGIETYRGKLICYSLGNFIFHSLARDQPLVLQRSMPPYKLEYVRPPELDESAIFVFSRTAKRWELELLPCAVDGHGESQPVAGTLAAAILHRIAAHSTGLGTEVKVEGTRGHLATSG